jgi:hypothetical protein
MSFGSNRGGQPASPAIVTTTARRSDAGRHWAFVLTNTLC